MKILIAIICCLQFMLPASAQETIVKTGKLIDGNKEIYHVLKSDAKIKQGMYQVTHKNQVIVSGMYSRNKMIGMWHYFNSRGTLLQNYDFDNRKLNYEAPDSSSFSKFTYLYDQNIKPTDRVTKPVRIGGRYYGYFPYIKLFRLVENSVQATNLKTVIFELLISPGGNLADSKLYLNYSLSQKVLQTDIGVLSPDDKLFIPATVNYESVSCRIRIECHVTNGAFVF